MRIRIIEKPPSVDITLREWNNIVKQAWGKVGFLWFKEMRPKHFTRAAYKEYGYQPRQGELGTRQLRQRGFRSSYTGQKLRKFGHTNPLVYSGTSLRRSRSGRITATSKGVRITLPTNALNLRRTAQHPDMAAELRTISETEVRRIELFLKTYIEHLLRTSGAPRLTVVAA